MPETQMGTLICIKCGQTRNVRSPKGVIPDETFQWHACDPENLASRRVNSDVWRVLSLIANNPLTIGGKSAEDSAYDDVKRKSTRILT